MDRLPVARDSDEIVRSIGLDAPMHADFGSGRYRGGPIGIPYTTVPRRQRGVPVSPWHLGGTPSRGWDNDDLHTLGRVRGRDFQVVDTRALPKPGR